MPCLSRLRRRVALVQVIEGEVDAVEKRRCDRSVMEHLAASGIAMEAVAITGDGCSFIIDSRDGARFASAIVNLSVALKFHAHCARVALTRTATDWPLPSLKRVMEALDNEGIGVVHLTSDATALTVLVDEREADRVAAIFSRFYQPAASNVSGRLAS